MAKDRLFKNINFNVNNSALLEDINHNDMENIILKQINSTGYCCIKEPYGDTLLYVATENGVTTYLNPKVIYDKNGNITHIK